MSSPRRLVRGRRRARRLITPCWSSCCSRRLLTVAYSGLDGDGTYGIAVVGTRELAAAIDRYRGQYHHIPDQREGLSKLAPEFLPSVDTDPWGHPYIYDPSGPDWADVLSYGADGKPGGGGANSDLSARFGRLGPHPPDVLRTLVTVLLVGLPLGAALGAVTWCDGVLAGMVAFWGGLVLAMIGGSLQSIVTPLSCDRRRQLSGRRHRPGARAAVRAHGHLPRRRRRLRDRPLPPQRLTSSPCPGRGRSARREAMSLRGRTAIAGLGITQQGKVYDRNHVGFAVEAVRLALEDAGLTRERSRRAAGQPRPRWGDGGMASFQLQQAMGLRNLRLSVEHERRRRDGAGR